MANIIDGLNKATNEDLRKLNAILKTYTLTNYFIQFFRCLGNVFRYIFRIKPKQAGMSFLYTNYQAQFDQMNRDELISWLKTYLISSHRVNIKGKEINDDLLSVSILKIAAHLYKNESYSHMSPAEMADDLKYKCADRKLTKITGVLKNWFFITLFLYIIACFLIVYYYRNYDLLFFRYYDFFSVHPDMLPRTSIVRNLITGAFVIIEVIWSKKCSSKLFYEKIGQVVALGGLAYNGPFSVSSSELIIPKMKKDVAEKFERGLRALHTLMQQIRTLEQDLQTFESLNLSLKYSINDCKNSIENAKKNPDERLDKKSQAELIQKLQREYEQKCDEFKQRKDSIKQINGYLPNLKKEKKNLQNKLIKLLATLWEHKYYTFRFLNSFYDSVLERFEWKSFLKIEERLLEMKETSDVKSLGDFVVGANILSYEFKFLIEADECSVVYSGTKPTELYQVKRSGELKDITLSAKDLEKVLVEFKILPSKKSNTNLSAENLIKEMQKRLKQKDSIIKELEDEKDKLVVEVETKEMENFAIEEDKKRLIKDRDSLIEEIKKANEEDKEELLKQIDELNASIAFLQEEYDNNNTYKDSIIEKYKKKLDESKMTIKTLDKDIVFLNNQLSDKQFLIDSLESEKKSLEEDIIQLNEKILLIESFLNEANSKIDNSDSKNQDHKETINEHSDTIQKLKSQLQKAKVALGKKQKKIEKLEKEKKSVVSENSKLNEDIENERAQQNQKISELEEKVKELEQKEPSVADILLDEKAFAAFKKCFIDAEKEIDIESPWLARFTVEEEFKKLMKTALDKGVTIKIHYGLKDNKDDRYFSYENLNKKINENSRNRTRFEWSISSIKTLHGLFDKDYPNQLISYRNENAQTHRKIVLVDSKYYMIGSYNFLSYDGRDGRGEVAEKIENSAKTDQYRAVLKFKNYTMTKPEYDCE